MTLGLVAALVVAGSIGLLSLACLRWSEAGLRDSPVLVGSLAAGIGLGLTSIVFFLWLSLVGGPSSLFPLSELALLVLLAGIGLRARARCRPRTRAEPLAKEAVGRAAPIRSLLGVALWITVGCAAIAFVLESIRNPQGGWDAWMTWNMHARAIYRGGDRWLEVLAGLPAWSHPDYPLLVPAGVVRLWTYMGEETTLAPASVAMTFTFATAGLLYAAVAALRSRTQGCLAALLLLGTKFFILHGASQYADVPLGFFLLATLALLACSEAWPDDRPRLLALAGLAAGLAAWTKNEGLLLLPAVLVGYGAVTVRARGWHAAARDARALALGLAPAAAVILWFKLQVAAGNDLMSDQGVRQTVARLLEGDRYLEVLAGLGRGFLEVSLQGMLGLLLLGYLVCAGPAPAGPWRLGARTGAIVLLLMLGGYVAVLLTAPTPFLATNIRSINRLLLQLWPSALLACFLGIRTIEEAGLFGQRPSRAETAPDRPDRSLLPLSEAS